MLRFLALIVLLVTSSVISRGQDYDWDVATSWCSPNGSCFDFTSGTSWQIYIGNYGYCTNGGYLSTWAGTSASCNQQALGEARGYGAVYNGWILTESGWIQREIGGLAASASGTTYYGETTGMWDEHYCDDYRDSWSGPVISPC